MNATHPYSGNAKTRHHIVTAPLRSCIWIILLLTPLISSAEEKRGEDSQIEKVTTGAVDARYPQMHRKLGVEGEVLLQYSVNRDGRAFDIKVLGDADPSFIASAVSSLRASQFAIPKTDGEIVELKDKKRLYKFELFNLPQPAASSNERALSNLKDQDLNTSLAASDPVLANR